MVHTTLPLRERGHVVFDAAATLCSRSRLAADRQDYIAYNDRFWQSTSVLPYMEQREWPQ